MAPGRTVHKRCGLNNLCSLWVCRFESVCLNAVIVKWLVTCIFLHLVLPWDAGCGKPCKGSQARRASIRLYAVQRV